MGLDALDNIKELPVSIVMPVYNEVHIVSKIVELLDNQTIPPSELVIIDAGSNDGTLDCFLKEYRKKNRNYNLTTYVSNGAYPGAARNKGMALSKHDWNVFLDAGIFPDKDWLEKLWLSREQGGLGIVLGQCDFQSDSLIGIAVLAVSYGVNKKTSTIPGSILKKEVFYKIGCFREDLRSAEDLEWKRRLRNYFQINSLPVCKTTVLHYTDVPDNFSDIFQKWRRNAIHTVYSGQMKIQIFIYMLLWFLIIFFLKYDIEIKLVTLIVILYIISRGVIGPIRRCNRFKWWGNKVGSLYLAPIVVLTIDFAKSVGFIIGIFNSLIGRR
jgi:glycosyltransferase involved in cell wall biosynthesis